LNTQNFYEKIIEHYKREEVRKEILKFSDGRWIAIHCELKDKSGRNLMFRYRKDGTPLTIRNSEDVLEILNAFKKMRPRTFYASAIKYSKIKEKEDVKNLDNSISSMPTWDIDLEKKDWRLAVNAAKLIRKVLESEGITRSIMFKWSGEGMHVHINEKAFSDEVFKRINPLDLAYSVTEYIIKKIRYDVPSGVRVDNEIDPQRVFTIPLSIHRSLNRVSVMISPDNLDSFDISWVNIDNYVHYKEWDKFEKGEADDLVEKAYKEIGGYPYTRSTQRRKEIGKEITDKIKEIEEKLKREGYL